MDERNDRRKVYGPREQREMVTDLFTILEEQIIYHRSAPEMDSLTLLRLASMWAELVETDRMLELAVRALDGADVAAETAEFERWREHRALLYDDDEDEE